MLSRNVVVHDGSTVGEHVVRNKINLSPPMSSISRDANSTFIGLEKSLDAVFLVQGLEVVVPCQYRKS
jgi:hypothetical protein